MSEWGRDSVSDSGESRAPAVPLYCAQCLSEGLPQSLAMIGEHEEMYANADGEPCCSRCGFENNLTAMNRERP